MLLTNARLVVAFMTDVPALRRFGVAVNINPRCCVSVSWGLATTISPHPNLPILVSLAARPFPAIPPRPKTRRLIDLCPKSSQQPSVIRGGWSWCPISPVVLCARQESVARFGLLDLGTHHAIACTPCIYVYAISVYATSVKVTDNAISGL